MELTDLRKRLDDLPGWLSYEEGETLYTLAQKCTGRGVIVEIGSWRGKSTTCLGLGSKAGRGVKIYSIDRHTDGTFPDFQVNIEKAGITELVTPIRSRSQDAWQDFDEPIELLFIDGAHQYDLVKDDFDHWVPKVVEGGVVAMHDTTWFEGPRRVADEMVFKSRGFKNARFVFSSTSLGTKVLDNTALDRARNRYSLTVKKGVELSRKVFDKDRLPAPLQAVGRKALRRLQ
ncbi:MAG TPA: class I SAM-dependent methyltransferase [Gaiellaceae bacterium]|nr:class I SAM-dependent methyltransferase [Gaiellaceae bacterium]